MAAIALAERFQTLGFRVIEGGKSGKLVVLNTPAVAEMFGRRHGDVLDSVREQQKILDGKFRQGFAEHCLPSQYKAADGKQQPCFNLTKIGFITVALKWDVELRFLLALAFEALENDDSRADELVVQINSRIRELRSRASGHAELDLPLPELRVFETSSEPTPIREAHDIPDLAELKEAAYEARFPRIRRRTTYAAAPLLFGDPLTKKDAHHKDGWKIQHFLNQDGQLAQLCMSSEHAQSTRMQHVYLADKNVKQFLFLWEENMPRLLALELLELECGITIKTRTVVIDFLKSQWMLGHRFDDQQ